MRAGDVMILLRRRDRYYRLVLAALQQAGVRVAGADRMKLEEQIEIRDLLALGDVMLLPDDDLQLAALLKSPLFDIDEETLFRLAHGRGRTTLHARLMEHAGGLDPVGRAADRLLRYRGLADSHSVYGFYSAVLTETRQEFRRRLGAAVDETIDHFLALAQSFGAGGGVSLTTFLAELRGSGGEVRRDMDSASGDEVRVMTVHGAKGLEAPVVFLPDMLEPMTSSDQLVRDRDSGFVYWAPGTVRPDFVVAAREGERERGREEENRLLYVALTRARDGIIIGGWEAKPTRRLEGSFYAHLRQSIASMDGVEEDGQGVLRVETAGTLPPVEQGPPTPPKEVVASDIPDWLSRSAPEEPRPSRPLRPSAPDSAAMGSRAPGTPFSVASAALKRGRLAHRMFEVLPAVPPERRAAAIDRLADGYPDLAPDAVRLLADEVALVMAMPALAPLFGEDAMAELSVTGEICGIGVAGQIDRMHVGDGRVLIADFKTGPRPAATPEAYVRQMALYAALIQQIYPDHAIETWIVWSEEAAVEIVDPDARDVVLAGLSSAGAP